MFFGNVKKLVLGSLVAGIAWSMTAPQADAFWHHRRWGSSGGSWGSYGSSGSSGGWYSERRQLGFVGQLGRLLWFVRLLGLERRLVLQRRQLGFERWQQGGSSGSMGGGVTRPFATFPPAARGR